VRGFYNQLQVGKRSPGQLLLDFRDHYPRFGLERPSIIPDLTRVDRLAAWFPRESIYELSLIRDVLEQCALPAARDCGLVALSAIVVAVSCQESETRLRKVRRQLPALATLRRWIGKIERMLSHLKHAEPALRTARARVYQGDARRLNFLPDNSVDLVVMSPPYANTLDYRAMQRHRLTWLGLEDGWESATEVGSHRRYSRGRMSDTEMEYEREISDVLAAIRKALRPGRLCAVVVGRSKVQGLPVDGVGCVTRTACHHGFAVSEVQPAIRAAMGRLTPMSRNVGSEQIVLLRRQ